MASVQTACSNDFFSFIERQTFLLHVINKSLQAHQSCVTLVAMVNVFLDTQFLEREHTTYTEQNLLFETVLVIATIELVSNGAIPFAIQLIVRIQQIEIDTSNGNAP